MRLTSNSFENNGPMPARCAFGVADAATHMQLGQNLSPQLSWSEVPTSANSLVLLCIDADAPAIADDVNQEGVVIAQDLPRTKFGHWGIVDLPPGDGALVEGECSNAVTVGGKEEPPGPTGTRQALNDYTGFLASDPDMKGSYFGYDGPCPPWNDARLHHYHFVLIALKTDHCNVRGKFTVADIELAIEGEVLAEARLVGTYSLNPDLA